MQPGSSIQWSAYPALLLATAFSLGVGLDLSVWNGDPTLWVASAVLGILLFTGAEWWDRRRMVTLAPLARMVALLLVAASAGAARHAVYTAPSPRSLGSVVERLPDPVTVRGRIDDAPERSASDVRFTVAVDSVSAAGPAVSVGGNVRVTLRPDPWDRPSGPFPRLSQGDHVRLRGRLSKPPGQRNPGGFDYAAYLSRRGVCCTMFVGHPDAVVRVHPSNRALTTLAVDVRKHVRRQVRRYVPSDDGRAVLFALLLGDRSRIEDDQRQQFARTGLMHLLAVSGLHVFLVGMVLYMLLRPILMRFHLGWHNVEIGRSVLTIAVLSLYMLLTGMRPSVVRAVIMSTLFIGGIALQRSTHPLNTLGVAALVLLVLRPTALFDVGFQLSMGAVAAIVSIHPRFVEWIPDPWTTSSAGDWLVSVVSVSAAATVGTAPILLYHFGWVSVAGLVLNVLGIPCTALALTAAVSMVVIGEASALVGAAFGSTADLFVRGLLFTSRHGALWLSWAGFRMPEPDYWVLGALCAASIALAQWPRPRYRWRSAICVLLFCTGAVWTGVLQARRGPTLDLLFFDVGQGDAVLVTTPKKRRVLVDTGPRSPGGSAIEYSVVPFLRQRGVDRVDVVVVTHPDGDHLGGLPTLLREMSVGRVIHSGQAVDTELYRATRRQLRERGIASESVHRGDTLSVDSSVRIEVLGPPRNPGRRGITSENGRSVVLRLTFGQTDILLTGDVEKVAEQDLVVTYGNSLDSRLVKIPHHGSETSSTRSFVESAVDGSKGTRAVVSVGQDNQFGMPDPGVLRRWEAAGATVQSTSRHGAVWVRSDGSGVSTVDWRR